MIARAFAFLTNALIAALLLGAALPGTHRVLYPESFGLTEIRPRVWTDAPGRESELLGLANEARATVRNFFGDEPPKPTLVLCTTRTCARTFGIKGNGLSIMDIAVMVSPGGLTRGTLTHEMTHNRLHRRMGPRNILRQPYPTWFDEGLATHVANHPKRPGQITAQDRARIRQVTRFWQWDDAFRQMGVGRAYTAAAAEVAAIEAQVGRGGLLDLIRRAEAGESFDDLLGQAMGE